MVDRHLSISVEKGASSGDCLFFSECVRRYGQSTLNWENDERRSDYLVMKGMSRAVGCVDGNDYGPKNLEKT